MRHHTPEDLRNALAELRRRVGADTGFAALSPREAAAMLAHVEKLKDAEKPVRIFYKTTISFEVLSEEPIPPHVDMEYIGTECDEGRYVGRFAATTERRLDPQETIKELYDFGSEPSFFELEDEIEQADR